MESPDDLALGLNQNFPLQINSLLEAIFVLVRDCLSSYLTGPPAQFYLNFLMKTRSPSWHSQKFD